MQQPVNFLLLVFIFLLGVFATHAFLWPCETSDDCAIVENATCSLSKLCRCPAGYVFSSDVTKCLLESLYGEQCEEAAQCSHMLSGAQCNAGVCECAEGLTYIRGRCKQLVNLHNTCEEDIDCVFSFDRESVVCQENRCQCSNGYYERSENICRRISMTVGEACIVQSDCQSGDNSIELECSTSFKCQDKNTREIGVQTSFDKRSSIKNGSFADPIIASKSVSIGVVTDDIIISKNFGDPCNGECEGLPHSICIQEQCHCKPGYYHKDGLCLGELGEVVDSPELCSAVFPVIYDSEERVCKCESNYFHNRNMRNCDKIAQGLNFGSCTQPSQCSPYGVSYCSSVTPKVCTCHAYAVLDEKNELCVAKEGYGAYCETTEDCTIQNAVCSDNQCLCAESYRERDNQCKAELTVSCETQEDCAAVNSECSDAKVCECKEEFVANSEHNCAEKVNTYGGQCEDDEQCTPLLGELGKCVDKSCTCEDHLQYRAGVCLEKKEIGESCIRENECFVTENKEAVTCRNGVCQCKFHFEQDLERQFCRAVMKGSSNRPSALKIITLLLTAAAVLVTSAAIKNAYY